MGNREVNKKALQYQRPRQLQLIEMPDPALSDNEVLIEVLYAGICGTDIHILAEESPAASPLIPGHEFSGKIVSVGGKISHLKEGQLVSVNPNNFCGWCRYCLQGQVHFCENLSPVGVQRNGGWSELCACPGELVLPLPDGVTPGHGALAEPLSCILHGWDRLRTLPENSQVLILGAGLIGNLWGLVLKNFGLIDFKISEPNESRRKLAENLGFRTIAPNELASNFSDSGIDVLIDCSGNPAAIENAVPLMNPLGKILFFGVCPMDAKMKISPFQVYRKELILIGSFINPFTFSRALSLLKYIRIPLEDLGVKFYTLEKYKEALKAARTGSAAKVMFTPNPSQIS